MNQFKRARLLVGLTQEELSEKLGITHVAVSRWESGKSFPKAKRIKDVADALNTTVSALLEDQGG